MPNEFKYKPKKANTPFIYKHKVHGNYLSFDNEQFHPMLQRIESQHLGGPGLYGTPWELAAEFGKWFVVYRVELEDKWYVSIRGGFTLYVLARVTLYRTAIRIAYNLAKSFPNNYVSDAPIMEKWLKLANENRKRSNKSKEYKEFCKKYNLQSPFRSIGVGPHAKERR